MDQKLEGSIKNCKMNLLQHEYYIYSNFIHNQTQHIEKLYKDNIITINVRNNCLRQLSDLIRFMNNGVYNERLKEINKSVREISSKDSLNVENRIEDTSDITECDIDENGKEINNLKDKTENKICILESSNIIQSTRYISINKSLCDIINSSITIKEDTIKIGLLLELCKNSKMSNISNLIIDDYDRLVKPKLLEICKEVGFLSLDDALCLLTGRYHKEQFKISSSMCADTNENSYNELAEHFELYNNLFVIIDYRKVESSDITNVPILKSELEWQLNKNVSISEMFIDSYGELTLSLQNSNIKYIFGGYFINDPIHSIVRTSQICRVFLYKKKRLFQLIAENETQGVMSKFADIWIKNMSIGEMLSYDKNSFKVALTTEYTRYMSITKMRSFKNQLDDFTKDNSIKNMFTMIKLLLMGPTECINIAGLLFGLTKDKKFGAEIIAEIIYRNLPYTLQIRLKKSSINLKTELDKLKAISESDIDIKKQLATNVHIPQLIKKCILDKLDEIKYGSNESGKQKLYCDTLIKYPWVNTDTIFETLRDDHVKCRKMMDNIYKVLTDQVYGHDECKNTIIELVCKMIMNPNSGGKALGLVGPPGTGKTLIAKKIGEAIGIPCTIISLCGVDDGAILSGHGYTYSGAMPGMIVRKMIEAGSARCIMFFDELDKACQKHGINEIQNIIINITDPNMNKSFSDNKSKIDPILLNRIHEIEIGSYNIKDKLKISKDFLLREIQQDIGLTHKSINLCDDDLEFIADNYTHEPGVRELKRKLETLFLKLNVDRIYRKGPFKCNCTKHIELCNECKSCEKCNNLNYLECNKCKNCAKCFIECNKNCILDINPENPITIDRVNIIKYLKEPKHESEKIHRDDMVGIINGVYATTNGFGGIIPILICKYYTSDKFCLHLTGSQGNVMKESVNFAFTIASNIVKTEYMEKFFKECYRGLHIHTPDGATPKDGPSAGCAFTTAFISRILGKKIRHDCAMTGEINMNGNVTAIGGLVYKLRGAKIAGVKTFFCPMANKKDYDAILKTDHELFNGLTVHCIENIIEVLPNVLVEDDGSCFDCSIYLN